jgi:hypothetical protein
MIRVVSIENGGTGSGHDLTADIEGLGFSSVDPGGDELAAFTYKRPWSNELPEVAKGNLLVIEEGLNVLWQGRLGEPARGAGESEELQITGYGTGIRLKDQLMSELYISKDLSRWQGMSAQRKINLLGAASGGGVGDGKATPDTSTGAPALLLEASGAWAAGYEPQIESWFDAGEDNLIAEIYGEWRRVNIGGASWAWNIANHTDDVGSGGNITSDLQAEPAATGTRQYNPSPPTRWGRLRLLWGGGAAGTDGQSFSLFWTDVAVIGDHGLTVRGIRPDHGFYASDLVRDSVARASGITVRRVDDSDFVIEDAEVSDEMIEEAVRQATRYHLHERTWGTWGPNDIFADRADGYFDWTERPTAAEWIAYRADCEDLSLSSELESLYDTIILTFTDAAGISQKVTRTLYSPDLDAAGMSGRTMKVSGGKLTAAAAAGLADAILAFSGVYAPAKGSATIARPVRHTTRGLLAPHRMRADGSMIRIPDVLPSSTLFALDGTPDKRTTFPIKRVRADLSGAYPRASVDVDQGADGLIEALQARLDLAARVATA